MKLISVPGIHSDGKGTTDKLGYGLEDLGHEFLNLDLPKRNALTARWKAKQDAQTIIDVSNPGDILLAHSFGCLRSGYAMREVEYLAVFLYRPAMSSEWQFPKNQKTAIYCIHSRQDYTIWIGAKLLRFSHPFGMAGFSGFKDPYVHNIPSYGDHNEDFDHDSIQHTIDWTYNTINSLTGNAK